MIKWLGETGVGQTRYQEYDPRTGAAIGTPLTEAQYRARSDLRPFTRVRVVPGIPLDPFWRPGTYQRQVPNLLNAIACNSLKKSLNASCLAVNELVDTYNKLIQAGVTPETHALMKSLIKKAYTNWQQLFTLIDGSGCGAGEMFCSVVHPPASWLV